MNSTASGVRNNALWGRGGRGIKVAVLGVVALLAVGAADVHLADAANAPKQPFVAKALLNRANAEPASMFDVVVTTSRGVRSGRVSAPGIKRYFPAINGFEAVLPGAALVGLSKNPNVDSITVNYAVKRTSLSNAQLWPDVAQVSSFWPSLEAGAQTPTVAVIDSGIDSTHPDLAGQVIGSATFVSSGTNTVDGDGRGHGTFVAGLLAGSAAGYAGAAPGAKLVSVDVLNDDGAGTLADVVAGTQWVLDHKDDYGIRVVNMSLNAGLASSFRWDPLDKAVEQLWFHGVVVVVAAGNYGHTDGTPSRVVYAPANDPFVITVGASDTNATVAPNDDFAAPWSAWGRTYDGFAKPDIAAPGRVMDGPVPGASTMLALHPERATGPGHMWLSGTSMAAPVVAGAAAELLAGHPTWTPDQIKGALMATAAHPDGYQSVGALGFGVLQAFAADGYAGAANPNAGLNQFVSTDPATGAPTFDAASWDSAARSNASWDSASWDSASWDSASWNSASWDSASWESASWDSASWDSASWESSTWLR